MPEALPPEYDAPLRATATRRGQFGTPIRYFHEIGSTNDEAGRLAEEGAGEGTTVVAAAQSAGRGRFGRTWFSPPGAGLYFSVIIRDARAAALLTLAGGVAVAEGIRAATALPVEIKWPNDIVIDGGLGRRRKIAGILAEGSAGADGLQHMVLGIGINVRPAAYPPEIADRATSVEGELGREVEPGSLLAECLCALADRVRDLAEGRSATVLSHWTALAPSAAGARVEWDASSGVLSGTTTGIDRDGALLVRVAGGIERIVSGSLRWA